jgi:hypothetical protein
MNPGMNTYLFKKCIAMKAYLTLVLTIFRPGAGP